MSRRSIAIIIAGCFAAALLLAGGVGLAVWWHHSPVHRFAVVHDGVLYRGAQPDDEAIALLARRYGVKTVVNLRGAEPQSDWWQAERDACHRRGVRLVDIPIGDPAVAAEGLKQFMSIVADPANRPVFVHCKAGKDRTGFAIAAYRIAVQGWSHDRAVSEARHLEYEPNQHQEPEYERILRELAAGRDWREIQGPTPAPTSGPASARD